MNTNPHQRLKTVLLTGLLAGVFVSACSADIIYQDTFARGTAGALAGTAPTVDNTGAAATWTASAGYTCDGTALVVNNGINLDWQGAASLPLDWLTTYPNPRVQVDMKLAQAGDWLSLDFGDCDYYGWPGMPAVMILRGNGDVDVCQGPGWDGAFVKAHFAAVANPVGWNRLRIEYSNTLQTASCYINGTLLTNLAVPDNAPLSGGPWNTGVGFNANCGGAAQVTNFVVTFGNENTFPPTISTQPQGETIFVGDTINLSLVAGGTLPLQYIWRKDGAPVAGPNANAFTLSPAALSDSGNYSVIITNAYGSITSAVARVDVHLEEQSALAQINFDDITNYLYEFGFTFSDGAILPVYWTNAPDGGVGGSGSFRMVADGSDFQNTSVTYAGFGGGVGLALPKLATANLAFYEAYCSARVENLLDTLTNDSGRVTLRFYKPDPATPDVYILVASATKSVNYTSNYQNFAFVLNTVDYGGSSGLAAFAQDLTNIVRVQFEFTVDNYYTTFVQGPGDAIVVDNLKLAFRHSPAISATFNGTQVLIQWDDPNVKLQGAADVTGPYTDITGAAAPYPVPGASPYHFFRTSFQTVP